MEVTSLESYYVIEKGQYVLYEFNAGFPKKVFSTSRLAISYDSRSLEFKVMGEPSYVMMWAALQRTSMRAAGNLPDAECLVVSFLPTNLEVREVNQVLQEPSYMTTFLAKAGLI